ncbi:MAG: hypothetical protein HY835_13585 [Anaerolineae bacterium]|nr:hypothetical protein [Anaerolineae bacterium]
MKTQWITNKGKKILLLDFSNCGHDINSVKPEMAHALQLIKSEPPNSVLTLTDVRGTRGSPEMFTLMRETSSKITPFAKKRAVVGITGAQQTFLNIINQFSSGKKIVQFDDIQEARDWLVNE